jgi:hypothetical protein
MHNLFSAPLIDRLYRPSVIPRRSRRGIQNVRICCDSPGFPFGFAQGGEPFDFAQDREPVERPVEPRVSPEPALTAGSLQGSPGMTILSECD